MIYRLSCGCSPGVYGVSAEYLSEKSSDKKSVEDDYFNIDDYDDAEDFYEDYYDDFWDYYDAEEYFYEHHSYMNLE